MTRRNINLSKHKTTVPCLNNPSNLDLIPNGIYEKIFLKRLNPCSCDDIYWSQVVSYLILSK